MAENENPEASSTSEQPAQERPRGGSSARSGGGGGRGGRGGGGRGGPGAGRGRGAGGGRSGARYHGVRRYRRHPHEESWLDQSAQHGTRGVGWLTAADHRGADRSRARDRSLEPWVSLTRQVEGGGGGGTCLEHTSGGERGDRRRPRRKRSPKGRFASSR